MTFVLILLAVFNAGFLIGTWWGSGWRRRERAELGGRIRRLESELLELSGPKPTEPIVLFDLRSKKRIG